MKQKFFKEDLINECRDLYNQRGISAFLYKNINKKLYFRLYKKGIKLSDVITKLGLNKEFKNLKKDEARWNWRKIIEIIRPIVINQNFLPPAGWFQNNGYAYLIQAVYSLDKNWDDLRKEFNSYENSKFVISRNGMRWLSHPEASLSNFLFSRGIEHHKGKKYPKEYSISTGQTYGYYDLEFVAKNGNVILVEVWGDKPYGHAETHYEYKKNLKLEFNSDNKNFIGISFRDCYVEKHLEKILKHYIGLIQPFNFQKTYDKIIPSTHWSNADELIEYCKIFTKDMPDGIFPTEEWLRKRGKWKNRDGEAYNTLSVYIKKWIGGIRQLREIIDQPQNSTVKWDKEKVIQEYRKIFESYGLTPNQLRWKLKNDQIELAEEERFNIQNIDAAVRKHFGSSYDLNQLLGIKTGRKW